MDEMKRGAREARDDAKKAWRGADGEDLGDKAANLGDDVRRNAANAGDDLRNVIDGAKDEAHHSEETLEDDATRAGRDPGDVQAQDLPR